jgi:hypothetical protein
MVVPVLELDGAQGLEVSTPVPRDIHPPRGIGEWERPKEDHVHDAKNRAVRSDPERQSEYDGRREARRPEQRSQRIHDVLFERVHALLPSRSWSTGRPFARL